jgi:hypothetical protein
MISGNKGFRKQPKPKTFKRSRHTHKPATGLVKEQVLDINKLTKLLHGTAPPTELEKQLNAERALKRAEHEAERQAIRNAAYLEEQRTKYQKETEMADLQTGLASIMDKWNEPQPTPEVAQVSTKTNASVSQTVFDYV